MRRRVWLLACIVGAACSASPASRASERAQVTTPAVVDSLPPRLPEVDVSGTWATGSVGEPSVPRLVLRPPCNVGPALWALQQRGDSLRLWQIPESYAQGIATETHVSSAPLTGRISGVDLVIGAGATRYRLRYDSTSGHLRGTLNGAPFWAVRQDVERPEGCIPPP
jgi:hypothetical protein